MANETAAAKAAEQETSRERGARQELVGIVTSAKMEKTIVVKVRRTTQHPLYQRVIRSAKKYYAHDETRRSARGRHGAHRFHAPAFEIEALAAQGSAAALDARGASLNGRRKD